MSILVKIGTFARSYASGCLPVHPSIRPSICCSHLEHRVSVKRFVSLRFLNLWQSLGRLGQRISRRKAATYTGQHKHRIIADKHPCLEWDSHPRSQRSRVRRQLMPCTARPLWSVIKIHLSIFILGLPSFAWYSYYWVRHHLCVLLDVIAWLINSLENGRWKTILPT
jgi:hypothetical protein